MKFTPDRTPLPERLAARSERQAGGCLVWTGPQHDDMGYCRIRVGTRMVYVHIAAWELANDQPVPEGMVIRHTCDRPPCIEPGHLITGTQADNVHDMFARGQCDRRGERNNSARLDWPAVREIRRLSSAGSTGSELAKHFAISESQVSNIIHHRQWKESA